MLFAKSPLTTVKLDNWNANWIISLQKAVQGSTTQSKSIWVKWEKTTSFLRKSSPKVEVKGEVVQSNSVISYIPLQPIAFSPYWLSNPLSKWAYLDTVWSPQFSFNPVKAREMTSICYMKGMGYELDQSYLWKSTSFVVVIWRIYLTFT